MDTHGRTPEEVWHDLWVIYQQHFGVLRACSGYSDSQGGPKDNNSTTSGFDECESSMSEEAK